MFSFLQMTDYIFHIYNVSNYYVSNSTPSSSKMFYRGVLKLFS